MVKVAQSLSAISERVSRFISADSVRMKELRTDIIPQFSEIGHTFIIGGLVRDLAFYGSDERPLADIDFVITGNPTNLEQLANRLGASKNRFGGFSLKKRGYDIDFWSMHSTWAKQNRLVRVNKPADLTRATFFDWDAIIYGLSDKKVHALPGYIEKLNNRILDINLEKTPSVHGNLVRALRRLVMWDAKPGRKLRPFISKNLPENTWQSIIDAEKDAFPVLYLSQFRTSHEFYRRVISMRGHHMTGIDDRRQASFSFNVDGAR